MMVIMVAMKMFILIIVIIVMMFTYLCSFLCLTATGFLSHETLMGDDEVDNDVKGDDGDGRVKSKLGDVDNGKIVMRMSMMMMSIMMMMMSMSMMMSIMLMLMIMMIKK